MAVQFLTLEYEPGNNYQYVITRVNGKEVEQYERELNAAKANQPKTKFSQFQILSDNPQQIILPTYLNKLGSDGWDFCAKLDENMILMKKPG